ncbi:MAG: virulence factor SrfB, partial [Comamonas sp.]|nr:virulence factor SrfB [Candidatus Comamonas equi]
DIGGVAYLVRDTGIQFMDFGVSLDPDKMGSGRFVRMGNQGLSRLLFNREDKNYFRLGATTVAAGDGQCSIEDDRQVTVVEEGDEALLVRMARSLEVLNGVWLPVPYFHFKGLRSYYAGPTNWARMRLVKLSEPDRAKNTHRLTLAFDTHPLERSAQSVYLAPSPDDIQAKAIFRVACQTFQLGWFLDQQWMRDWLEEVFRDSCRGRRREAVQQDLDEQLHIGHYLNILSLLAEPEEEECAPLGTKATIAVPRVHLVSNLIAGNQLEQPIKVDMVLDVGNSRTCGILIEDHGQTNEGLNHSYVLKMRDLHDPERVYTEPFASRVEFAQMTFGKENHSKFSGRHDAFQWPTIARVGTEATRLCALRKGSEGSTGLSSPKRYLWDNNAYQHGWRFSTAFGRAEDSEAKATAAPFSTRITDSGQVFYAVKDEMDRMPAFLPHYSRSSLMTFMLAEVITQALTQINSVAQRIHMSHATKPRVLSSITLTVPPGMSQVERKLLNDRVQHAVALVWQCMGWHDGAIDPYKDKALLHKPPSVKVEWDEAACSQLVYLYTEIRENFSGHADEFFNVLARPDKQDRTSIAVGSIDIGGGTTDLVINDYCLDRSGGSVVAIVPKQRFRDSFKVAGDDILLDVIQKLVLPALSQALAQAQVASPEALLSTLCGAENIAAPEAVCRQQLNLQVFVPIGLRILRDYERYDPELGAEPLTQSFSAWMGAEVGERVRNYVAKTVLDKANVANFEIGQVPLEVNFARIHKDFVDGRYNITKVLDALCEVIVQYPCDTLLLTGHPSMLPGVQAYLRRQMVVPPGRILPMHGYHTNVWYPFHQGGKIEDPKTTAAVGAAVCLISGKKRLDKFYFNAERLKPYSTMRHIGAMDSNGLIKNADLFYRDVIKRDDKGFEYLQLSDNGETPSLRLLGKTRIGYRQLDVERWAASPLYLLELTPQAAAKLATASSMDQDVPHLKVKLRVAKEDEDERNEWSIVAEDLVVDDDIRTNADGCDFSKKDVRLQLYTMNNAESSGATYWMDSGSVK